MNMFKLENPLSASWIWSIVWLLVVTISLAIRPILPIDETRYLSVAWEMWIHDNYLVPHLNGNPYSHKPPLLFWIINAGWWMIGVNEIWPRLIAPLFGLGCLVITALIEKKINRHVSIYATAPLFLIGSLYWLLYTTLTMFDLMITFWTLTGMYGLLLIQMDKKNFFGWLLFGVSIGLGALSKGPVIMIFLLPCALIAPLWKQKDHKYPWLFYYLSLLTSLALGAIIALSWAIPAGQAGGIEYKEAILWGQSTGRIIQSFAHQRPFWWYLLIFPLLMLPWAIWPSLLKKIWVLVISQTPKNKIGVLNQNTRFIFSWAIPPMLILSIISGKQPHYLFPILPAIAIGLSTLISKLSETEIISKRLDIAPVAIISFLFGIFIMISPEILMDLEKNELTNGLFPGWALPLFIYTIIVLYVPPKTIPGKVIAICCFSTICVLTIQAFVRPVVYNAYNLKPIAKMIANAQSRGYAVANMDKYHGQYNFLGRITKPIVFTDSNLLVNWLKENPKSKIISYHYTSPKKYSPEYYQNFRGRYIAIWDGKQLSKNPQFAHRE